MCLFIILDWVSIFSFVFFFVSKICVRLVFFSFFFSLKLSEVLQVYIEFKVVDSNFKIYLICPPVHKIVDNNPSCKQKYTTYIRHTMLFNFLWVSYDNEKLRVS